MSAQTEEDVRALLIAADYLDEFAALLDAERGDCGVIQLAVHLREMAQQ